MGNGASNVEVDSYDGAWYTECNGIMVVTVPQILMKD